ncbi:unnamed protein product [Dracunculus medinensis]|uniref:PDZ domain-containing protein n=1 Tax=Dracunculus medinensis TaxID=318479 RepID=A0A0N4UFV3_DRAME|nr:unnamed protein product [Dracunculus medinensis]
MIFQFAFSFHTSYCMRLFRYSQTSLSLGRSFLKSLTNSHLCQSLISLDKLKTWSRFYIEGELNYQNVLDVVSVDQKVITNPRLNSRRRTVFVVRKNKEPFGFTIQSYLLKSLDNDAHFKISYVDYVHFDSPAAEAGMRIGDVIISINGELVLEMSHSKLIKLINSCVEMRMVVIFENIKEHIELSARAIRLKKLLNDKLFQLNLIDIEEQKILNRNFLFPLIILH